MIGENPWAAGGAGRIRAATAAFMLWGVAMFAIMGYCWSTSNMPEPETDMVIPLVSGMVALVAMFAIGVFAAESRAGSVTGMIAASLLIGVATAIPMIVNTRFDPAEIAWRYAGDDPSDSEIRFGPVPFEIINDIRVRGETPASLKMFWLRDPAAVRKIAGSPVNLVCAEGGWAALYRKDRYRYTLVRTERADLEGVCERAALTARLAERAGGE